MEAREESFDHTGSRDLEASQLGDLTGIEQIEAGSGGHSGRKLTDARASGPGDTRVPYRFSVKFQVIRKHWVTRT